MSIRIYSLVAAVVLTFGCTSGDPSTPPQKNVVTPSQTQRAQVKRVQVQQTAVQRVEAILLARHARDLPTRANLDKHPDAEASLHTLAKTAKRFMVRVRALTLLGTYHTAKTEKLLLQTLADKTLHSKLRAAAVGGLAGFDLTARADLRTVVIAQLTSPHPMVGATAVRALAKVPLARQALEALQHMPAVSDVVKREASLATTK